MIGCVLRCSARGSAQRSGGRSPCKRRWFTRRLPGPISLISLDANAPEPFGMRISVSLELNNSRNWSMTTSLRHKEIVRGKILYYLGLIYPQAATLPLLQGELDFFGYPIPLEELNFHAAYPAEKGLVSVERVRGPPTHRNISLVKITATGIHYRDGRLPTDEGIYLEPGR